MSSGDDLMRASPPITMTLKMRTGDRALPPPARQTKCAEVGRANSAHSVVSSHAGHDPLAQI